MVALALLLIALFTLAVLFAALYDATGPDPGECPTVDDVDAVLEAAYDAEQDAVDLFAEVGEAVPSNR